MCVAVYIIHRSIHPGSIESLASQDAKESPQINDLSHLGGLWMDLVISPSKISSNEFGQCTHIWPTYLDCDFLSFFMLFLPYFSVPGSISHGSASARSRPSNSDRWCLLTGASPGGCIGDPPLSNLAKLDRSPGQVIARALVSLGTYTVRYS